MKKILPLIVASMGLAAQADTTPLSEKAKAFIGRYKILSCRGFPTRAKQPAELVISQGTEQDEDETYETLDFNRDPIPAPLNLRGYNRRFTRRHSDPTECSLDTGHAVTYRMILPNDARVTGLEVRDESGTAFCLPPLPPALTLFTKTDARTVRLYPISAESSSYRLEFHEKNEETKPAEVTRFTCELEKL